jgi:hypothetical protein
MKKEKLFWKRADKMLFGKFLSIVNALEAALEGGGA